MTTIDELTRLDREIAAAERRALLNLAEHLRGAVLEMPSESKLARSFVRHAAGFQARAAGSGDPGLAGKVELENLGQEVSHDLRSQLAEAMMPFIELMAPHDSLRPSLEHIAHILEGWDA